VITGGVIYSVTRNKVFGLAEVSGHDIQTEIYQDFYGMKSDIVVPEKMTSMNDFDQTAKKMKGHTATGLTQVRLLFLPLLPPHVPYY
jgi:hypothetical protein